MGISSIAVLEGSLFAAQGRPCVIGKYDATTGEGKS
jgi:hypothetical protein